MGGVESDLTYPRVLPDLFRGSQVTIIGRYRNAADLRAIRLRLMGKTNEQTRAFTYENLSFPLDASDNDFLPRLWATRRVGWLMEQIRTNGEQRELVDEIKDLGTRYGIVTPYTSYLALEQNAAVDEMVTVSAAPGNRPLVVRSAEPKDKTAARNGIVYGAPPPSAAPTATTGAGAVYNSKKDRARQEALRDVDDDVWTDAEFKADAKLPETVLTFGTDAYFAALKREPKLADYFALGERVVVVYKGQVYRVNAATK
jgi:Ca-activated chloride channel family protein